MFYALLFWAELFYSAFIQPVINAYTSFESLVEPYLQHLDPSLFQNIILGILAIFIPYAILISEKEQGNKFRKMVFKDEILRPKNIFWLSVISIAFFAFFSGAETPNSAKIASVLVAVYVISLFVFAFLRVLRFSGGYRREYELAFLKKLVFSKGLFKFRNKIKSEKMLRTWDAAWSEELDPQREGDYTECFISHIDSAIKQNYFDLTNRVADSYVQAIDKRNFYFMHSMMLPKVLEWHEELSHETGEHAAGVKPDDAPMLGWNYFGQYFFKAIVKATLKDKPGLPYPDLRFESFKRYVDEIEKKINPSEDKQEKHKYREYLYRLFHVFCPLIFSETIDGEPSQYDWRHHFPYEWRVSKENTQGGDLSHYF